jgi:broad specificity phosphatase PhoE
MSVTDTTAKAGSDREPAFAVPAQLADDIAIWLVRHGQTQWSKSGRHTGRTDVPLTAQGELEARALRGVLAGLRPAWVVSSPRTRAIRTAELAGVHVGEVVDDLAEWNYGDYEGLTSAQIRERVPGWSLWTHGVAGGETVAEVSARADRVLRLAIDHIDAGPVLLFAHGHISRIIGARWIGLSARDGGRLALATAAVSVLGAEHNRAVIDHWNIPNPAEQAT